MKKFFLILLSLLACSVNSNVQSWSSFPTAYSTNEWVHFAISESPVCLAILYSVDHYNLIVFPFSLSFYLFDNNYELWSIIFCSRTVAKCKYQLFPSEQMKLQNIHICLTYLAERYESKRKARVFKDFPQDMTRLRRKDFYSSHFTYLAEAGERYLLSIFDKTFLYADCDCFNLKDDVFHSSSVMTTKTFSI